MQQEPDVLVFIEADLDEVVPCAKRPQVIHSLHVVQLGILHDDRLVGWLHFCPHVEVMRWGVRPRAAVVLAAVVSTPVRHRLLNCRANAMQIVRQMAGVQRGLHGHHAATNIHTDCRGNDRATGRITLPTVAPMPQCTSGMAATHL